ncbi:MAG: hypothetical protein IKE30_04210 [Clostridia bacterium]|nr:hypothetical protein [Clostridia bacterium]
MKSWSDPNTRGDCPAAGGGRSLPAAFSRREEYPCGTVFHQRALGPIDEQIDEAMLIVKRNIRLDSRTAGVFRADIYDNRLDVTSPGRISSDLTMEPLKAGNSDHSKVRATYSVFEDDGKR